MIVQRILASNFRGSSIAHLKAPSSLEKIALEIINELEQVGSVWKKWGEPRDSFVSLALDCWIPKEDLLSFLNSIPGPPLTLTDLEQRMRHLIEVEYISFPEPKLQEECLEIYRSEANAGTEMAAIIGHLAEYVASQHRRVAEKKKAENDKRLEDERLKRERRLMSHSDCSWTQIKGNKDFFCRKNARLYQLKANSDKSWTMYRVQEIDNNSDGKYIGRYKFRVDATKILEKIAYEADF